MEQAGAELSVLALTCPFALLSSAFSLYCRCQGREEPGKQGGSVGRLTGSRTSILLSLLIVIVMAAIANLGVFVPLIVPLAGKGQSGPIGIALLLPFALMSDKKSVGSDRPERPTTIWSFCTLGLAALLRYLDSVMVEDREVWVEKLDLSSMAGSELLDRTRVVSQRILGRVDGQSSRTGAILGYVSVIEKKIQKADDPNISRFAQERARRDAIESFRHMRRRAYRWGFHRDHIWAVSTSTVSRRVSTGPPT